MNSRRLKVVGLFSGIGGVELGLRAAGHETALLCEINEAARNVLTAKFPGVEIAQDVRAIKALPEGTDLLTAGFPCQDLSQAGTTAGLDGERSGLVNHVFRLIKKTRVPWVLLENVRFMLRVGKGRAMGTIVRQFEKLGYRWAYRVVDSQAFGLPQRRERVFFLASLDDDPRSVLLVDDAGSMPQPSGKRPSYGFYWSEGNHGLGWAVEAVPPLKGGSSNGGAVPPAILLPDGSILKPDIRDAERMQGFRVGWTKAGGSERERWRLVGNAVSVPVAEWIGRRLATPGSYAVSMFDKPLERPVWPEAAWSMRQGRFESPVSIWPEARTRPRLESFLRYDGCTLSARATSGFLSRATASTLRCFPPDFLSRVQSHLERVELADEVAQEAVGAR